MINTVFFQNQQKKNPKDTDIICSPASRTSSTTCYTLNEQLKSSQVHRREYVNILVFFQTLKQTEEMITKAWKNLLNMEGSSSEDQASFFVKTS